MVFMNNYRINFLNPDDTVAKSYTLYDGLDNIRMSADRIAGIDYFMKDPRRLEFTILSDDWLYDNIMSGDNELDYHISIYRVTFYQNDILQFSGFVDMSFASYDERTEEVTILCYEHIRLAGLYSEMTRPVRFGHGSSVVMAFTQYMQAIDETLPWDMSINYITIDGPNLSYLQIHKTRLLIFEDVWNMTDIDWEPVSHKFYVGFSGHRYIVYISLVRKNTSLNRWRMDIRARTYRFANKICPMELKSHSFDYRSREFNNQGTAEIEGANDFPTNWYRDRITNLTDNLNSGLNYISVPSFAVDYIRDAQNEIVGYRTLQQVRATGNVISDTIEFDAEKSEIGYLAALKAVMFWHNWTVMTSNEGIISLVNKNNTTPSPIRTIAVADVFEFRKSRKDRPQIDTKVFDVLAGDTTVLTAVMTEYYKQFLNQKWVVNMKVNGSINLALFTRIRIEGRSEIYQIVSIQKDFVKNMIDIECWEQ